MKLAPITCTVTSTSYTRVDNALWAIESYLMHRYGTLRAEQDVDPLKWYINTSRASNSFVRAIINAKPFMIARRLHEGGSYEDAIKRVRTYLDSVTVIDDHC